MLYFSIMHILGRTVLWSRWRSLNQAKSHITCLQFQYLVLKISANRACFAHSSFKQNAILKLKTVVHTVCSQIIFKVVGCKTLYKVSKKNHIKP